MTKVRMKERFGHAAGVCALICFCALNILMSLYNFLIRNPIEQAHALLSVLLDWVTV